MANVLITGASGFTGTALAERLTKEPGLRLFGISRSVPTNSHLYSQIFHLDLETPGNAAAILDQIKPQWIIHLAGKLKGTPSELVQANFAATIYFLNAAAQFAPFARILLIGSAAEYGKPMDAAAIPETSRCLPETPYGLSKYAMTLLGLRVASETNLQINIARAFNIIGPGCPKSLLLGALIERVQKARASGLTTIAVGDVTPERDFLDVRDAVEAYLAIIKSEATGQIFNVCTGTAVKIEALVESVLAVCGEDLRYEVEPNLGSPGAPRVIGNPKKISGLGFAPRFSLQQSIADACAAIEA